MFTGFGLCSCVCVCLFWGFCFVYLVLLPWSLPGGLGFGLCLVFWLCWVGLFVSYCVCIGFVLGLSYLDFVLAIVGFGCLFWCLILRLFRWLCFSFGFVLLCLFSEVLFFLLLYFGFDGFDCLCWLLT